METLISACTSSAVAISEIVRNYAIVAAGVVGLALAFWRGLALSRQSKASVDQASIARRAHVTEVFKDAVSQLNHERIEIRLGAIFTLRQISEDFVDRRHYVVQVLTGYVRERTADVDPEQEPTPDIKEILTFLKENLSEG